jgi:hypothetical protein
MDLASIAHFAVIGVAFLSGAYVVFVTAQKADGLLKPVGVLLAALLVLTAVLAIGAHSMGKGKGEPSAPVAGKQMPARADGK